MPPARVDLLAAHIAPGAFLKALILHLDSAEHRQLCEHLSKAEREEKCIRRTFLLTALLLLFSLAGLGYCAILLPEVFRSPTHLVMRSLCVLGLGSLISQAIFLACLLRHRAEAGRLHEECRRVVLDLTRSKLQAPSGSSLSVHVQAQSPGTFFRSSTPQPERMLNEPPRQEAVRSRS